MNHTKTISGKEAREAILAGMDLVAFPVANSMGAQGRNTAFNGPMGAEVTNDGVTIARLINPSDPHQKIGAEMLKQTAEQTNSEAGDGTSGSIVFAHSLVTEGFSDERTSMTIRRELNAEKEVLVAELKKLSKPVENNEQLLDVAKISVEDEKIAQVVVDAVVKADKYGAVIVEEGMGYSIEMESAQGYYWPKGYVSPYMATTERGEAFLENAAIILTDRHMTSNKELVGILGELKQTGATSVLIVADNVEGELLQTLIINKMKAILTCVVVKRPGSIEELEDIAILTDAIAVTKDKGVKEITMPYCGTAQRVVVSKDKTIIIGKDSDRLKQRIESIAAELKDNKDDELLKKRMGMLASGIVHLRVGAKTETERTYLKRKVDDAVLACIAAQEEGIVPGGGATLAKLAEFVTSPILKKALLAPRHWILTNAEIEDDGKDYNVVTGKLVKDHFKEGIIDPTKVIRCEIENGISLGGAVLTIENLTAVIPEQPQVVLQQHQG